MAYVSELIEKLQQLPPEAEVYIQTETGAQVLDILYSVNLYDYSNETGKYPLAEGHPYYDRKIVIIEAE